ncbi:myogenesis-regulating glycosidase-like [Drosophila tropicalis]|uniref:myogenesis-regulating glycosidase-like n=1 Tax=Drosophila tropicalis TaxID=46794 RepID=UPI0035ABD9C8
MRKYSVSWYTLLLLALYCGGQLIDSCQSIEQRFQFPNSDVYVRLRRGEKLQYELMKGSVSLQTVTLDTFVSSGDLELTSTGGYKVFSDVDSTSIEFSLVRSEVVSGTGSEVTHVRIARSEIVLGTQPTDCFDLQQKHLHWFSGPEQKKQYWPVQRQEHNNYSYVPKEYDNCAITERYWLNSAGVIIYVEDSVPLFLEQNTAAHQHQLCLRANRALPYDYRSTTANFVYHIAVAKDAKAAHRYAVKTFLGKPTGIPDERMIKHPVWSTWALYKTSVSDEIVREFAKNIIENGFNNSQIEIDDDWEDCYGALTFRKSKFPNTKQLTDDLKEMGFRTTLWIHPFINIDCEAAYAEAKELGHVVVNHDGNPETRWWNSDTDQALAIDFTRPAAAEWFIQRLKRLQEEDGIDNFKFDAGETSYLPSDPSFEDTEEGEISPLQYTKAYVRAVSTFGEFLEIRSGQGTQELPVFVRIVDKDSNWGWNNGLLTLITTLLQMNLNGYPFVLPDMIGGNGYAEGPPNKELYLRWLQANVFMPALQFSYVPWNFDDEAIEISKKFTDMHAEYAPYIVRLFKRAVETGEPVNVPLWWLDPEDEVAQGIFDEFLLGDDILAAPVVVQGATKRDVYLPEGQWNNGNAMHELYNGPIWLMDYSAPLDTLPFFVRVGFKIDEDQD